QYHRTGRHTRTSRRGDCQLLRLGRTRCADSRVRSLCRRTGVWQGVDSMYPCARRRAGSLCVCDSIKEEPMLGPNDLSLCCGTVRHADFRQLVEAASTNGYRAISLWPHLYLNARTQGLNDTDLRNILKDNDIVITVLDPLCNWIPGCQPPTERGTMTPEFYE